MPIFDGDVLIAHPLEDRPVDPYRVVRDSRPSSAYTTLSRRPVGGRVEIDDRAYHSGSAVTLPFQHSTVKLVVTGQALAWRDEEFAAAFRESNPEEYAEWDELFAQPGEKQIVEPANDRLTLSLAATACLLFASDQNAGVSLLIAGHSTRDEDEYGPELAAARAQNLRALISGDRQSFMESCVAFNVADDLKPIGHFLGRFFGWAFSLEALDDPGQAVFCFRRGYNERFGKASFEGWFAEALPNGEGITAADWGGLYDCYSMVIAAMVGSATADELATARGRVKFVGDGHGGYASAVPRQTDASRSRTNRRVEILGFPEDVAARIAGDLDGAYAYCDYLTFDPNWMLAAPTTVYTIEPSITQLDGTDPFVLEGTLPTRPEGLEYVRWLYENQPAWRGRMEIDKGFLA